MGAGRKACGRVTPPVTWQTTLPTLGERWSSCDADESHAIGALDEDGEGEAPHLIWPQLQNRGRAKKGRAALALERQDRVSTNPSTRCSFMMSMLSCTSIHQCVTPKTILRESESSLDTRSCKGPWLPMESRALSTRIDFESYVLTMIEDSLRLAFTCYCTKDLIVL
jgi:hypothetical protein